MNGHSDLPFINNHHSPNEWLPPSSSSSSSSRLHVSGPGGRSVSYESDGNTSGRLDGKNNLCDYSDDDDERLDIDDDSMPAPTTTLGPTGQTAGQLRSKLEGNDTH